MTSLSAPLTLREGSRFIALALAAPALLLVAHLLPATGPGLAFRLAAAAVCVLLLPGALVLRAAGWPARPGIAVAASLALSLAVVALGLVLVFAANGSIALAAVVLVIVSAAAAAAGLRQGAPVAPRVERRAIVAVLAAAVPVSAVVWWTAGPLVGDSYFHIARVRKLTEFDSLSTLSTVNEFKDGGLHPGYAFPLLHGAEALIARFASVDVADVVVYLPAILVPLAFVLGYAAGSAVFRSPAGGLALVAIQAAQVGFSRRDPFFEGAGLHETLSQPQAASRLLLTPAIIALAFTFIVEGGWIVLASLAAAALALSAIHPSYTPYVALVFGGFLLARVLLVRGWERVLTRTALALGTIIVPLGFLLVLLFPVIRETRAVTPSGANRAAEFALNRNNFTALGDWFGYSPSAIAREGPVVVAGLLAVPLAGFAARRLWAAFVLGGSLAVLTVLLTPPLFTALSDVFSVSQSRRLAGFIPIAFAVVGACFVVSRWRAAGLALAAGASVLLMLLYPGEFTRRLEEGGPEWAVAVAVGGGLVALVAGARRGGECHSHGVWAVASAVVFVLPITVAGLASLQRVRPLSELTPAVAAAVRARANPGDIVFSDPKTAFEVAAFAPVYINAGPLGNVTDTLENRPRARSADARRFFQGRSVTDVRRHAILRRYGADWVVVDKEKPHPTVFLQALQRVFEDDRYALYRARG